MKNEMSDNIARVEAILFACGTPVSLERIAVSACIDRIAAGEALSQLERKYNVESGGVRVIRIEDSFQLATREEYADYVRAALEVKRQELTQAALETLAVVAYNQPTTKAFVEQVRGIDSGSVVNTLVERGLLAEAGRLELPGRPVTYKTTDHFLRCFGMKDLSELPPIPSGDPQMTLFGDDPEDFSDGMPEQLDSEDQPPEPPKMTPPEREADQ
jgi:segregation and condensation protein B